MAHTAITRISRKSCRVPLLRVLGVSVALSEAEVHWRAVLDSLIRRGLKGVKLIVSDDHAGLKAAHRATLPSVPWQRRCASR